MLVGGIISLFAPTDMNPYFIKTKINVFIPIKLKSDFDTELKTNNVIQIQACGIDKDDFIKMKFTLIHAYLSSN